MATTAPTRTRFEARHRHDRAMIATALLAIWMAFVLGFGIDLVNRAKNHQLDFPLVVHLHAVAYVGWLVVLAAQVWLVRTGNVRAHRKLGAAALVLLPMMLVLGPAAAIADVANPYMPDRWVAWLCVQFTNAFGAVALLAAGYLWRKRAAAHKRLMVMGTIAMTEPGFGRIIEAPLVARWGDAPLPFFVTTYIGTVVLVLAVGAYDLATRRRLHPAYVAAAVWILANELLSDWLFHQPWWLVAAKRISGHPL